MSRFLGLKPEITYKANTVIRSVSEDQEQIINDIAILYLDGQQIELDPTYSTGSFYKRLPKPLHKFDLVPQLKEVQRADCRVLPFKDNSIASIMFDPPFIVNGDNKATGIITQRFSSFHSMTELFSMYEDSLEEFYRILKPGGVLIFKCQDTICSSKQYLVHVNVINMAEKLGFYSKDLFILTSRSRLLDPRIKKQQHARKFHSYFIVFIKKEK